MKFKHKLFWISASLAPLAFACWLAYEVWRDLEESEPDDWTLFEGGW